MQILTRNEALEYWSDPSQQVMGLDVNQLPEPGAGVDYYADGPLAVMVHSSFWPDVWMFHIGVKPDGWGKLREHAQRLIRDVFQHTEASRLTTWIDETNRAAIAMAKRNGFVLDGSMPVGSSRVLMFGTSVSDKNDQND